MKIRLIDIIVISILLFFFGTFFFLIKSHPNQINITINSKVKNLYRDYDNHGQGTVVMDDNKKLIVRDGIYYQLKIGDSLIKKENSLKIKAVRGESIFYLNLEYE
ncbi:MULTISPECIES: hypothetical protein [unclassified Chryseobacterium]|uniref:hypothetical protein n=1 Tax=unclassified Chryseobacterium TaxID=2593645 RepID=UPI003017615F